MSLSIQITDSISTIEKNINSAIVLVINNHITKNLNKIVSSVQSLIPGWIKVQPEIISLLSNEPTSLAGQFGIQKNAESIVNNIIQAVVSSTEIKFIKYNSKFSGGLELRFQPKDFSNLLSLNDGHTIYSGGDLHWLDWLLKRGDSIIVANYEYNPQTGLGRSGLGNMVSGGSFRVPPQFSGTIDDNFITRAFLGSDQEQQITTILQKILK